MAADSEKTSLNRLILFTRYPTPGKAKTRLIPALGPHGAARFHRRMTETILAAANAPPVERAWEIEVRYDGGSREKMREWLGPEVDLAPQGTGNIGRRMRRALEDAITQGYDSAVLIGADIIGLDQSVLTAAFQSLNRYGMVIGPARDGGYYLIGVRRQFQRASLNTLFENISWGSDQVLSQSLAAIRRLDISHQLLPPLQDVDRPEDLVDWLAAARPGIKNETGKISVIIPTIDEADQIGNTISAVGKDPDVEVILADGGSSDRTRKIAKAHGAAIVASKPPRSAQMNAGARSAAGDVLLFLHADTRLPAEFHRVVMETICRRGVSAGAFSLKIDDARPSLRLIERYANRRSKYMQLPYGDQALFIKKALFDVLGGFAEIPIMDDVDLVRRARRVGEIAIVEPPVLTSARRWQKMGVMRTTMVNYFLIFAYFMGVSPDRLARWYRREAVLRRPK